MSLCPCHSGKAYEDCCGPLHKGVPATCALEVMRSRYSAYALGNVEYILATTHPRHHDNQKPLAKRIASIQSFSKNNQFVGLEILSDEPGVTQSYVTFKAILLQKGKDHSFIERSLFEKVDGKWLYVEGEISAG